MFSIKHIQTLFFMLLIIALKILLKKFLKSINDNRLKIIFNNKNLSYEANNIGIKKAINDNCNQMLIINNDVEFETNLINNLLATQSKFDCSLVAPKMKYFYE